MELLNSIKNGTSCYDERERERERGGSEGEIGLTCGIAVDRKPIVCL